MLVQGEGTPCEKALLRRGGGGVIIVDGPPLNLTCNLTPSIISAK